MSVDLLKSYFISVETFGHVVTYSHQASKCLSKLFASGYLC